MQLYTHFRFITNAVHSFMNFFSPPFTSENSSINYLRKIFIKIN